MQGDADIRCGRCGSPLPATAKFCSECGAPVETRSAEYKQVTVLFADVVHSMTVAAAVGAERLREIMTELLEMSAAVVRRYDGTVDKFTGDGLMAVFGAPVALEDHAPRACLAALGLQDEARRLGAEVRRRDGVDLQLRVGLNSGQVIAGELGCGGFGYTTIGEQVGMAQRMEAIAPPGAVMLSTSTARLVERTAVLGDLEQVTVKGADEPVAVRRLLAVGDPRWTERDEAPLVGRRWELSAAEGLLDDALDGHGAVVGLVGQPGIGKSRLAREVAAMAVRRGLEVTRVFCESHATQVPFHTVAELLRTGIGVDSVDVMAARARLRATVVDVDAEDLLLLEDLLGVGDPDAVLPDIDPDARRRRLTALVNATSLAREAPAVYVIEDVHWIDEVSESMLADFFTVIPQARVLVVVTYRPEYRGALARVRGGHVIALGPLRGSETATVVSGLLGSDPSVAEVASAIAERAAGNPFFAQEMVRDLAERGVLRGTPGAYVPTVPVAEIQVPATLQTTIAARIDRLGHSAKRTLWAAAVIGNRFRLDLLDALGVQPVVDDLVAAQLIDQITFNRHPEYAFRHPLIRTVAYESQLRTERSRTHRRLALAIEQRGQPDEDAALIAEHLEAAGDVRSAYDWRMRAASWSQGRDIRAGRINWERARALAEALPDSDPDRTALAIAPRMLLCAMTWRFGADVADTGFDELRELCESRGDNLSLAIAMYGEVTTSTFQNRLREASALASEQFRLLQDSPDALSALGFIHGAVMAKAVAGEPIEALRIADWAIDLLGGDPTSGGSPSAGSPLAMTLLWRGITAMSLGDDTWRGDLRRAIDVEREIYPDRTVLTFIVGITHMFECLVRTIVPDDQAASETAEAVRRVEEIGDDVALGMGYVARGMVLSHRGTQAEVDLGLDYLRRGRDLHERTRILPTVLIADIRIAEMTADAGDVATAITRLREVVDVLVETGEQFTRGPATAALVRCLLMRGTADDVNEAEAEIERLAAVATQPGFVLYDLHLHWMRALLARARGDHAGFTEHVERYRAMATALGFDGHIAIADALR